jgi:putative spermidine/putrescine transport system substrate-binding protein
MRTRSTAQAFRGTAIVASASILAAGCALGGAPTKQVDAAELARQPMGTVEEGVLGGVTMTYVDYGGEPQTQKEKVWVEPFAERSGASMLTDSPTETAKVKAQVNSGNVQWDVVVSGADDVAGNCGTLFEPLDYEIIDASAQAENFPKHDCYVPALGFAYAFFYDADKYKNNPPDGWEDFFNNEQYPGTRAVDGRPLPLSGTLEAALLADGVAPENLYPLDVGRALNVYDGIKEELIFWETGAQQTQMADSGEADMIMAWSARILEANRNGANYVPVWNQAFPLYDVFAVVKGSPNKNAAMAFINFAIGAEQQAKMSQLTSYSPVNVNADPEFDSMAQDFDIAREEISDQLVAVDIQYWADQAEMITEAYTNWLQQ